MSSRSVTIMFQMLSDSYHSYTLEQDPSYAFH